MSTGHNTNLLYRENTLACDIILRSIFYFPLYAVGLRSAYPGDPWFRAATLSARVPPPETRDGDEVVLTSEGAQGHSQQSKNKKTYSEEFLARRITNLCGNASVSCLGCCRGGCCTHVPVILDVSLEQSSSTLTLTVLPDHVAEVADLLSNDLCDLSGQRIFVEILGTKAAALQQ